MEKVRTQKISFVYFCHNNSLEPNVLVSVRLWGSGVFQTDPPHSLCQSSLTSHKSNVWEELMSEADASGGKPSGADTLKWLL